MTKKILAIDLGASSGRGIVGRFDGRTIALEEVHRFPNAPIEAGGSLCWDAERLLREIEQSIRNAGEDLLSVGVDTWGVDFGLIDGGGRLMCPPVHYRDPRTRGTVTEAEKLMPLEELYSVTGNQIMEINTAFQLMALKKQRPDQYESAASVALMPGLFSYLLAGGEITADRTIASTTQLYDQRTGGWASDTAERLGLRTDFLPKIVEPGTVIGQIPGGPKVTAVCGHDTQSALVAVPAKEEDFAFLSCGTWSLLGTEVSEPILNESSFKNDFTNEAAFGGRTAFLQNITGLYLLQQSRKAWAERGEELSFDELRAMAEAEEPFRSLIDTDDPCFSEPEDMPEAIREYCRRTDQPVPENVGQVVRCIYESLAIKYRSALKGMEACTGKRYGTLYMVGGGSMDPMLAQLTADACGIKVSCGPKEASALGNVAVQLIALGEIPDLEAAREIVSRSVEPAVYEPRDTGRWESALEKLNRKD